MKPRIIGIGAGGHAKVVIDTLRLCDEFELVGLVDADRLLHGKTVNGVPVLGDDSMLESLRKDGIRHAFIGVGGIANMSRRMDVFDRICSMGFEIVGAIHPRASVSPSAKLGLGVQVMACAVVNADVMVGDNTIVNSSATVEHNTVVQCHCHISPGAVVCGGVTIASESFVGAGAVIREGVNIGKKAVIGAGAVVLYDVPDGDTVAGVPAASILRPVLTPPS